MKHNEAEKLLIIDSGSDHDPNPKDITNDVDDIEYDDSTQKYSVRFRSGNTYDYNKKRIHYYVFMQYIHIEGLLITSTNEGTLPDVQSVEAYTEMLTSDPLYRVTFKNGKSSFYLGNELSFDKKASTFSAFKYLCDICTAIRPVGEEYENYLLDQYKRIDSMQLKRLSLGSYIDPSLFSPEFYEKPDVVVYPFGTNLSQMQAVDNALTNQLSIIEGPPGTGKTQTILNIIANLLMQKKSILVVSPNNHATDNVIEKLITNDMGFLVARLGSRLNIEGDDKKSIKGFRNNQTGKYPEELKKYNHSFKESERARLFIADTSSRLRNLLETQREYRSALSLLDNYRRQQYSFSLEHSDVEPPHHRSSVSYEKVLKAFDYVKNLSVKNNQKAVSRTISAFKKLQLMILEGIGSWRFYQQPLGDIEASLFALKLESSIKKCENDAKRMSDHIEKNELNELMTELMYRSQVLLKKYLYDTYGNRNERQIFTDIWNTDPTVFRKEYPIVTSTIDAAFNQLGKSKLPFDYVIIDESSQASVVKGALALASAKNAVVIGDVKQLPPVISPSEANQANEYSMLSGSGLDDYHYTKHSLLSSIKSLLDKNLLVAPKVLLREHYRCNPKIIGFCNEKYYDGELIIMTENDSSVSSVLKVVYTVDVNLDRVNDYNRRQADDFALELQTLSQEYSLANIGVVAPYVRQVEGMQREERFRGNNKESTLAIATIHSYQGREKDVIAFITTRNRITTFLDNPNLVNVAVSRARERLLVFTSDALINTAENEVNNISELVRYIRYQGGEVMRSKSCSVYDILKDETKLRTVLADSNVDYTVGYELAEQLTEIELHRILEQIKLHRTINYIKHYSLKLLISDSLSLSKREREFVDQGAHVDIVCFRFTDKRPLFGIEVNGSQHYYDSRQQERDELKLSIFSKADIPLYVLPTHGSNETKILTRAILDSIKNADNDRPNLYIPAIISVPDDDEYDDWLKSQDE